MDDRKLTVAEYVAAFETWARVSGLSDEFRAPEHNEHGALTTILAGALAHLRVMFPDTEAREPQAYCDVMEHYAADLARTDPSKRGHLGELRMRVSKSCLLDRLIYCGEPLRTRPCPKHKGTWAGVHFNQRCECRGPCGCTTGWLPETGGSR